MNNSKPNQKAINIYFLLVFSYYLFAAKAIAVKVFALHWLFSNLFLCKACCRVEKLKSH